MTAYDPEKWEPVFGQDHAQKSNVMSETVMNLRGLKCPLPALRVRKKLASLKSGDVIAAECTDPLTAIDIPNLLRQTGDILEAKAQANDVLTFRIRKA